MMSRSTSGAGTVMGFEVATPVRSDLGRQLALREYDPVPILFGLGGDVAHHVFDGEVLLERVVAHVLAETRCADAAVRHLADDRDVVVDPHASGVDLAGRTLCAVHVTGPRRGGQSV